MRLPGPKSTMFCCFANNLELIALGSTAHSYRQLLRTLSWSKRSRNPVTVLCQLRYITEQRQALYVKARNRDETFVGLKTWGRGRPEYLNAKKTFFLATAPPQTAWPRCGNLLHSPRHSSWCRVENLTSNVSCAYAACLPKSLYQNLPMSVGLIHFRWVLCRHATV